MKTMQVLRPNFEKRDGLVVVVVQDATTLEVLMVAYTDEAGWRQTLKTGLASFYSTSRKTSWVKGETSGNFMKMVDMLVDCDGDSLVYLVEPQGNRLACHTDAHSCFYRHVTGSVPDDPAPKAGETEALPFVEANVHERL